MEAGTQATGELQFALPSRRRTKVLTKIRSGLRQMLSSPSGEGTAAAAPPAVAVPKIAPPLPVELAKSLQSVCERIRSGQPVSANELLPFLCVEYKGQRARVNAKLAEAYLAQGNLPQAKIFADRAWLLSDFSDKVIEVYKSVHLALGDTAAIREAHKRLGLAAAARGWTGRAIELFDIVHFSYCEFEKIDRWEYDFDVMTALDRLAEPHRFHHTVAPRAAEQKLRVGYLLRGMTQVNSVLVKGALLLAKYHDKSKFDISFYTPECASQLEKSPHGKDYIAKFKALGFSVYPAPENAGIEKGQALVATARQIHQHSLDVLVAAAGMADYSNYFLCALRPAPTIVGLVQGPPAQFAAPHFDWSIAWSKHPLMDTPVDCTLVELKADCVNKADVVPVTRSSLGVPDDGFVLISAGRYPKFQSEQHWQAMSAVLERHPNAWYVVLGCEQNEVPCFASCVSASVQHKVRFLGWRGDVSEVVSACDLAVDSYPSGAGQFIVEAMAMELPIVAHQNDYMCQFDQTNWSPVEDFIAHPELVVPRADWNALQRSIDKMIADETYRKSMGKLCSDAVRNVDPAEGIREIEAVYERLVSSRI